MFGKLLFWPKLCFRAEKPIPASEVKEILLIRTAYIGDVVMTLPMLKPLKKKFPNAKLTFLTAFGAKAVLDNNPYVDAVISYDAFWFYATPKSRYPGFIREFRKRRFDLVIEARADIRDILFLVWPATARYKVSYNVGGGSYLLTHVAPYRGLKHKVAYHLDLAEYLGCDTNELEWGIYLTSDEKQQVRNVLKGKKLAEPFLCAHPGARLLLKRWPPDKCAQLYDRIIQTYGMPIALVGSGEEIPLVTDIANRMKHRPITLAGDLTIRTLAGVLSKAEAFICNDSGPMHIAACMDTPTVAIFGPSKSVETAPYGKIHRVVEKAVPCRYQCPESSCRNAHYHICMESIQVEDVFQAVEEILS